MAAGDLTTEFMPQSDRDVMGVALGEMGRKLASLVSDVQRSSVIVSSVITEVAATAKKLGVSFYHYIRDRVAKTYAMPSLADLITERAAQQPLGASWDSG